MRAVERMVFDPRRDGCPAISWIPVGRATGCLVCNLPHEPCTRHLDAAVQDSYFPHDSHLRTLCRGATKLQIQAEVAVMGGCNNGTVARPICRAVFAGCTFTATKAFGNASAATRGKSATEHHTVPQSMTV